MHLSHHNLNLELLAIAIIDRVVNTIKFFIMEWYGMVW